MVQPALGDGDEKMPDCNLAPVGCLGRITSFAETGDGRYIVSLTGICRFRLIGEKVSHDPFRTFRIAPFISDLSARDEEDAVDRAALLSAFRAYLDANKLEADWESVERASNLTLVNSLAMLATVNTFVATAAAVISWAIVESLTRGKASMVFNVKTGVQFDDKVFRVPYESIPGTAASRD